VRTYWGEKIGAWMRLAAAGSVLVCLFAGAAAAQGLIPGDFFTAPVDPGKPMAVEAGSLTFDAVNNVITADDDVVVSSQGYTAKGEHLVYDRASRNAHFVGAVTVEDPSGNVLETTDLELTDGMMRALIEALTITTYDGARITADSADYDKALQTILVNANYAPCGECIDDQGRRIGWSVSASKITYNNVDGSVALEQPSLALLGIPVMWLPYLWLPDTSDTVLADMRMPTIDYGEETGVRVEVPYKAYSTRNTDIILYPTLLSRQGFLMGAEWIQRFDNGSFSIKASGLYQMDREAFAGTTGDRDWRGAVQTAGEFRPIQDWKVGWSYTAFTDASYLRDYRLTTAKAAINQVYATNLTADTYIDLRLQRFNRLGAAADAEAEDTRQGIQADAIPNARFDHVTRLAEGFGQIEVSGKLLGVRREQDHRTSARGIPTGTIPDDYERVPYVFGYAGNKTHARFDAGWTNQWITGGLVTTPYIGGRADVAYYDGNSDHVNAPEETSLFSMTPIAAMDVRFPLAGSDGSTVHLVEPIVQLVYRGSDRTAVGITNDDAQSFVFDDTNLFSFNRFSGSDRQETGLRANIGGRYQASFIDGSYLELIAGQSFQLAGENAFAAADQTQTGVGSGLEDDASYAVLGAYANFTGGLKFGGKVQVDTDDFTVSRGGVEASYRNDWFTTALDYHYIAANEDVGTLIDQHEIGVDVGVPVADYWTITGGIDWDITANQWLQVNGGLDYNDGYLQFGAGVSRTGPTHRSPDDTRFLASFRISAPAGFNLGYRGNFLLPDE